MPPKPPLEPDEDDMPPPRDELDEDDTLLPREPADTEPALRLAVLELLLGAELMLLPADELLTPPATDAALLVAALTRAVESAADLLVAATPPPVPADCPETAEREACSAVLRESVCADCTVLGEEVEGAGGDE